ncbi:MAG: SLC13 family permease [Phycisphaeraceae bacterium]|nr:SLC13 family permease [Phycisphaeraceae bacterium]
MGWEAWVTLGTIARVLLALARNWAGPDTILLGGLTLLMTAGLFSHGKLPAPGQAVVGFGNEGLITIAVLFVVAGGLSHTGAMSMLLQPLLGRPRTVLGAQTRMMGPVAVLSAFLNNTPIVAMFMPVISDWCKRTGLSPSKLFLPLSYAAILGGVCTLIGTSTNLVVFGMVRHSLASGELHDIHIGMFTLTALGVPVAVAGMTYVLIASPWLLPDRAGKRVSDEAGRRYAVEMLVETGSAIDGKSIEEAGLRHLPGVFLADIERQGERLVAVGPEQVLRGDDRLFFVGNIDSVVDLQRLRGLLPATNQVFKLEDPRPNRCLIEAVVSDRCPLRGRTIREGRFRTVYDAVVIAVHRGGQHLRQKIGDIVLEPGDTLLIEAHPRFVDQYRHSRDFFLVSQVADSSPMRHDRAWLALAILLAMVIAVTGGWMTMLHAALLAAGLMVLTRCCSSAEARRAVDWRLLVVIGAALGIGDALKHSGAADAIADLMIGLAGHRPLLLLMMVYLTCNVFTELVTNNAAAVLVYPIALTAAERAGVSFMPFVMAIMIAASASFSTPIGYQTNLMVYGAGGYRFTDYLKFGLPLNLLVMGVVMAVAPHVWPF